jgi:eukaryotic-like serine/threonine-protein kinase
MGNSLPRPSSGRRFCTQCDRRYGPRMGFCPFDGTPLSDDPHVVFRDPLIGQVIDDRYLVEEVLGEGGMGRVYRVRHQILDRPFALKVLRSDLAEDAVLAERFAREARAVAAIHHPNVVAITDFGRLPSAQPYFVMQLVQGVTLGRIIRERKTLGSREVIYFARHIARALSAAHEVEVIHRDLKPDNVLVSESAGTSPRVTVLDFGLAKLIGQRRLTQQGVVFGTPQYMSPEQASGEGIDHRVDVYALGVVMFEMLAGRPPFEADTYMGVLTKQLYAHPPRPSELDPSLGDIGELEEVVLACLRKNRDERIASMPALIERLNAIDGGGAEGRVDSVRPPRVDSVRPPMVSQVDAMTAPRSARGGEDAHSWPWLVGGTVALGVALLLLLLRARAITAGEQDGVTGETPSAVVRGVSTRPTSPRKASGPATAVAESTGVRVGLLPPAAVSRASPRDPRAEVSLPAVGTARRPVSRKSETLRGEAPLRDGGAAAVGRPDTSGSEMGDPWAK